MNSLTLKSTLTLASTLLAVAALHAADGLVKYESQPGSMVRIDGTSTIHDWATVGKVVGGSMELDPAFEADLKAPKQTPKVEISIPVRSLKSQVLMGSSKMDQVMQAHMSMDKFPKIEYRLLELAPKGADGQFEAKGALTISGVTKTNAMAVKFERADGGKVKVSGTANLKMTDFGIKPPAPEILGMSTIKTGDDVKITFEWLTAKAAQ